MMRFFRIFLVLPLLIFGCVTIDSRIKSFERNSDFLIGKDSLLYLDDKNLVDLEEIEGKKIYHYKNSNGCKNAFVVDDKTDLIIDWYYEGPKENCYVGSGWGEPW